ncbi:hypothetical protein KKH15_01335 [Patescibacteria group bacterium]|nr:hypothetical protein [Patescibacteria group bacterium]MBU1755370.1 hypothetical protein [Patescibacteria group bacterium]
MKTSHKRLLLVLAGLIIVAIAGYAIWTAMPHEREARPSIYRNADYNYVLVYPSNYDLLERGRSNVVIGHRTDKGMSAIVEATGIQVRDGEQFASYDDFLMRKSREFCGADLPTITQVCTEVVSQEVYISDTNVEGVTYYLTELTTNLSTGEVTTGRAGPFYAYDLSAINAGTQYAAVVIRPAPGVAPADVDSDLIKEVARQITLLAPTSR